MPTAFATPCAEAAQSLGVDAAAPCDDECAAKLDAAAGGILDKRLAETLDALKAAGAGRIVVDVTNNHGGSDWVEPVVRILGGPVRAERLSMVKHPAWKTELKARLADLEASRADSNETDRSRLDRAIGQARKALSELDRACDLTPAWGDWGHAFESKPLPCSNLVEGRLYSTGFEDYASPAESGNQILFSPARYGRYREGATHLPRIVLVNDDTHSSAELLAAALQDARAATIVGTVTPGAGCGQATSGTAITLPVSGAVVHVPDCVRLRADGSSERRGIVPDVLVPWGPADSPMMRVEKAAAALAR
jgi:hypothetical protein